MITPNSRIHPSHHRHAMLGHYWASVIDGGPAVIQDWLNLLWKGTHYYKLSEYQICFEMGKEYQLCLAGQHIASIRLSPLASWLVFNQIPRETIGDEASAIIQRVASVFCSPATIYVKSSPAFHVCLS